MNASKSTGRLLTSAAPFAAAAAGLVMGLGATHLPAGGRSKVSTESIGPAVIRLSISAAIRAAQPAVFMIGTLDDDGGFEQIGTGFAIHDTADRARVATAAHVAEKVIVAQKAGTKVVVRRPGTGSPTDFAVNAEPDIQRV